MKPLNEQKTASAAARIVQEARKHRPSFGRVLDVGCGTGQILLAASPFATSLAGMDLDEEAMTSAHDLVPSALLRAGSVESALPFEPAVFDTVFFCDVIEHLHNPFDALLNLRHVLAPDGLLVVTTPNANAMMRSIQRESWYGLADESHLIFFTSFTLSHILKKAGFAGTSARTIGGTGNAAFDAVLETLWNGGTLLAFARKPDGLPESTGADA